jgi:hypothetical protein
MKMPTTTTPDDDDRGNMTLLDLLEWHRQETVSHAKDLAAAETDDARAYHEERRFFHQEAVDILELTCAAGCLGMGFEAVREDELRRREGKGQA